MLTPLGPRSDAKAAAPDTLRQDPAPQDVELSYNPQDDVVLPPGTLLLKNVGPGPSVEKAELAGEPIKPVDGKYVYPESDKRYHAANSLAAVARTIQIFGDALGRPITWAFNSDSGKLDVIPDDGKMLNAFYSREDGSLHFFHAEDPVTKQTVWSSDSGEVVSHECGHAILDGLRPGYFSAWSPDPAAFHESFGDVMALLVSLQDDRVLDKVVEQTGGDLTKPNLAANLGEQLGMAINHTVGKNVTGGDYTRTALNSFKWQDPASLPEKGGPDQLGSEAHSFSRLWTGAFYDVLTGIASQNLKAGMAPKEALRAASTEGLKMYANLFKTTAPKGDFTYRQMAEALVQAEDQNDGGKWSDLVKQVYTDRGILSGDAPPPSSPPPDQPFVDKNPFQSLAESTRPVRVSLHGSEYGIFDGAHVETPVDTEAPPFKDAEVTLSVQANLKKLIAAGRIKYADPGQQLKKEDYFQPDGRPYMGVVRWVDGQMNLERVKIAD